MTSKSHGYIFALLAITIFSLQDAISKHLGTAYSPVFVTMIRYWAFAAFCLVVAARRTGGIRATMRTARPWLQVARGVVLAAQVAIAIGSFALAGLAQSQAIFSATPIVVAMLSIPLLGERVGWRRWTAIVVGLGGVLLILLPAALQQQSVFDWKLVLPVVGAINFAIYIIATRLVSRYDRPATSQFYTGVVGALAISTVGPFHWASDVAPQDWLWLGCVCVTSTASHSMLIRAYDLLDASAVQPLTYLSLVYASIIGVTLFGESLSWNMIVGSLIVVAAGIFTLWREYLKRHAPAVEIVPA